MRIMVAAVLVLYLFGWCATFKKLLTVLWPRLLSEAMGYRVTRESEIGPAAPVSASSVWHSR